MAPNLTNLKNTQTSFLIGATTISRIATDLQRLVSCAVEDNACCAVEHFTEWTWRQRCQMPNASLFKSIRKVIKMLFERHFYDFSDVICQ
jgi:hypothetical protein